VTAENEFEIAIAFVRPSHIKSIQAKIKDCSRVSLAFEYQGTITYLM
jgi:hypothetical protein